MSIIKVTTRMMIKMTMINSFQIFKSQIVKTTMRRVMINRMMTARIANKKGDQIIRRRLQTNECPYTHQTVLSINS